MMRRAMDYGKMFGKVFMAHCQDNGLVGDGQVNEGVVSTRLGMLGWPAAGGGAPKSLATSSCASSRAARCTSSTSPRPRASRWFARPRNPACL